MGRACASTILPTFTLEMIGRGERIRTSDPLLPKQVLYQAEPRPDVHWDCLRRG